MVEAGNIHHISPPSYTKTVKSESICDSVIPNKWA